MDEMEGAAGSTRYWCHMCSEMVNPVMEVEVMKCPHCESGFVEEMGSAISSSSTSVENNHPFPDDYFFGGGGAGPGIESDRALSLWAPILLGMMSNPRRRRRFRRRQEYADEYDDEDESERNNSVQHEGETELDRELESIIRRRRSSATVLQLLHGIRAGMLTESDNSASDNRDGNNRDNADIRDRERVILINPFNQTIIVQGGSYDSNNSQNQGHNPIGSLGDYFIGPGLDLLLQHLAENDPNRYGTPPAQKEAVEALPTVKIEENLQCSVCLDDFEIGSEAKEMPCKHKFHCGCIMPWLELHSSCPICRYQLPSDESKLDSDGFRNNSSNINSGESNDNNGGMGEDGDGRNGSGRRFSMPLPWPFRSLFSSSGGNESGTGNGNGNSSTPSSSSAASAPRNGSHTDEN